MPTQEEESMEEMKKRRPSGKKKYKPHVSTKIKWALDDALTATLAAGEHLKACLAWMDHTRSLMNLDNRVLAQLGKLDHEIAHLAINLGELERILATSLAVARPLAPPSGPPKTAAEPVRSGTMTPAELDVVMRQMYEDGAGLRPIAEALAVSTEFVRRRLMRLGVPRRPSGGAKKTSE